MRDCPHIISPAGLAFIKAFEQFRDKAYRDSGGVWTIGFGHVAGVNEGDTCTPEQAEQWFAFDAAAKAKQVDLETFDVPTTQNQFDAMASLAFNIGSKAFCVSSVTTWHRLSMYPKAADAFTLWNKAHIGGVLVEVLGLTRRRQAERALYLKPDDPTGAST